MNGAMTAIIRKDFRAVTTNKHLLTGLLVVPIALTIVMPSIFLFMIHFAPEETDIQKMLEILPPSMRSENPELTAARMVLNFVLPVFFLIIPVMAASIMAASSFVGEKEKHTPVSYTHLDVYKRQAPLWAAESGEHPAGTAIRRTGGDPEAGLWKTQPHFPQIL